MRSDDGGLGRVGNGFGVRVEEKGERREEEQASKGQRWSRAIRGTVFGCK